MFRFSRISHLGSKHSAVPRVPSRQLQQSTAKRAAETRAWVFGGAVALLGGFYVTHLESVPQTGRTRFVLVTREAARALAARDSTAIAEEFRGHFLTASDARLAQVVRVGRRVAEAAEAFFPPPRVYTKVEWRFNVIDSEEKNAVVLPGGQVFVFTGLLDELKTDQALAAVLSHEAAHMVLAHDAEKWSQKLSYSLRHWGLWALGYYPFALDALTRPADEVVAGLPNSSTLEAEANKLGVDIMASASYDPRLYIKTFVALEKKNHAAQNDIEFARSHRVGQEGMPALIEHVVRHYDLAEKDQEEFLLDVSLTAP